MYTRKLAWLSLAPVLVSFVAATLFAAEDDLTLGKKVPAERAAQPASPTEPAPATPGDTAAAPVAEVHQVRPHAAKHAEPITVTPAAGESVGDAWDRYFASQEEQLASAGDAGTLRNELLASVRETVRQLMKRQKYSEVSTLIQAALRHGQVESWMYEALALAIRADSLGKKVDAAQNEELERALLSAVDFAQDEDQLVMIAAYMAQCGLERRALSLYQQIAKANPSRGEAYAQGLALAQKLNDVDAIRWAAVGILSQAWTGPEQATAERALRIAKATYQQLMSDGKKAEAEAFRAAVGRAQERDCLIVVTWTGDADVDLSVEEPTGTVVSQRQPRSTSGGVHLGDVSSADGKSTTKGFTETYVCPQGFDGQYRALIKSVWGRPTSGKVTIDIYRHYGSPAQTVTHDQIPLVDKDAVAVFDLKEGHRKDALPEARLASAVKVQNAANRAVLAQQLAGLNNPQVASSFAGSMMASNALGFMPGFFLRGAVGYRPVISQFPTGANMRGMAVISADRRYVRVSPSPFFSQITEVNTFNYVTGTGGTQTGANGGGSSGSGGFGSGIGGSGSSGGVF
jgi:hypothetical protein